MDRKASAVNREVAIDFPGDGSYNHRPPHSPTLGRAHWNSFTIENQTPHEQVRHFFNFIILNLLMIKSISFLLEQGF